MRHPAIMGISIALALAATVGTAQAKAPRWRPVEDVVYQQEVGYRIPTDTPIQAVAVFGGDVYTGGANGLQRLVGREGFDSVSGAPHEPVHRLAAIHGALWLVTEKGLHRFAAGVWQRVAEGDFADVCAHGGDVMVAGREGLSRFGDNGLDPLTSSRRGPATLLAAASYGETLYCLGKERLALFDGQRYEWEDVIDFGEFPVTEMRDVLAFGSRLLVATAKGLGVLRGTAATVIRGPDGLPCEDTRVLAQGFARDYWIGTSRGAIRAVDGEFHYFSAPRWLPNDAVNDIACGDSAAYIATDGGLGIIEYEPYTLLKKAAYYERHLEEWGQKRMAFVHILQWNPDKGGWVREVSDNDVGWSTHYWAAQAFKYAATKDPVARERAVAGFNAMKFSEEVTSIDGFPARSVWGVGETGNRTTGGSGGYPAEWNPTPDGQWAWKGDTSSDETDAHFYYAAIFYELAANDPEKEAVRDHLNRVSTHIIDNGWVLRDLDGKPTVWARWDPEYFAGKGRYAKGLNGMEILNYMRTAQAITGDPKYAAALQQLLDMDYTAEVLRQKLVFPRSFIFHSDDRLAFYNYYTLLQYETDPHLRSIYARSLERSYEIERIEHNPWFNFIYGARTGNDCETEEAVKHLREWPLDLVQYSFDFSHRADLVTPEGYVPYCGVTRAFSPRERGPGRWTNNMGAVRGGYSGHEVEDPSGWLDAYWMGRYYGFILPPDTDDPKLTTVPDRALRLGAVPYDGPPMPDVLEQWRSR